MLARGQRSRQGKKVKSSRLLRAIQDYMANQKEIISTINNLIEMLKDGEKGFKEAADAVNDPQLKSLFTGYSNSDRALRASCRRGPEAWARPSRKQVGAPPGQCTAAGST
jgi:rubrerythrin